MHPDEHREPTHLSKLVNSHTAQAGNRSAFKFEKFSWDHLNQAIRLDPSLNEPREVLRPHHFLVAGWGDMK